MNQSKKYSVKAVLYMFFHTSFSIPFILACSIVTVPLADIIYTWKITNRSLVNAHMQG